MRKDILDTGQIYHVFSKCIQEVRAFNNDVEYGRMIETVKYYRFGGKDIKYSLYKQIENNEKENLTVNNIGKKLVEIIAYCIMPNHMHFILKQVCDGGISMFMKNVLISYTRYYNIKNKRKGSLWEGRFKNVLVEKDEQLLHLSRYIHLNPVTAYLTDKPEKWIASSCREYLGLSGNSEFVCEFGKYLGIEKNSYKLFLYEQINEQRELAKAKKDFDV